MNISKISLLLIAPYQSMADNILEICRDYPDIDLESFIGNLEDGIHYYQESMSIRQYDAILSRGGTADILRQTTPIPVIDVEVSTYDMLRAILSAKQYGRDFVIIGFSNITTHAHQICETTGWNLNIYEIHSREDAEQFILKLYAEDPRILIVGDVVSSDTAENLGMNNILITSGQESIRKALDHVISLFHNAASDREKALFFRLILDHASESAIVYDEKGQLLYTNFSKSEPERLQLSEALVEKIPYLRQSGSLTAEIQLFGTSISVKGMAISGPPFYFVFWLNSTDTVLKELGTAVSFKKEVSIRPQLSLMDSSEYMQPIAEKLKAIFPSQNIPLGSCIYFDSPSAAAGSSAASYVHTHFKLQAHCLITLRCGLLTYEDWEALLHELDTPFGRLPHTIYFENPELLPQKLQEYIGASIKCIKNRYLILTSSSKSLQNLALSGQLSQTLYVQLCSLKLHIPSLNERKKDIPVFAHFLIQQYNKEYSRQIIGLDKDVVLAFQQYNWAFDAEQFEQIIFQLLQNCTGHYLTFSDLEILSDNSFSKAVEKESLISLNGTLEEIELKIIQKIVKEENMNYTKAAKRLGISRSTLWRKLSASKDIEN